MDNEICGEPFPLLRLNQDVLLQSLRFLDPFFVVMTLAKVNKRFYSLCRNPISIGELDHREHLYNDKVVRYKKYEHGYISMPIVIRKMFAQLVKTVRIKAVMDYDHFEHWFAEMKDYVKPTSIELWTCERLLEDDVIQRVFESWPSIKKVWMYMACAFPKVGQFPNVEELQMPGIALAEAKERIVAFPKLKQVTIDEDEYRDDCEEFLESHTFWSEFFSKIPELRTFTPPGAATDEEIIMMLSIIFRKCRNLVSFTKFKLAKNDVCPGILGIYHFGEVFVISPMYRQSPNFHQILNIKEARQIVDLLKQHGEVLMGCTCFNGSMVQDYSRQNQYCWLSNLKIMKNASAQLSPHDQYYAMALMQCVYCSLQCVCKRLLEQSKALERSCERSLHSLDNDFQRADGITNSLDEN